MESSQHPVGVSVGSRATINSGLLEVPSGCSGEQMGKEEEYEQGDHVGEPCRGTDESRGDWVGARQWGWTVIWEVGSKDLDGVSCRGRMRQRRLGFPSHIHWATCPWSRRRDRPSHSPAQSILWLPALSSQYGGRPGGWGDSSSSTSCVDLGKWSNL